ncbi:uncharacterized protein TNCV_3420571 [Trichonephila clavipes]|nr:uncharacterized protein TNCV_3420571 [Trichonephila clavipes]
MHTKSVKVQSPLSLSPNGVVRNFGVAAGQLRVIGIESWLACLEFEPSTTKDPLYSDDESVINNASPVPIQNEEHHENQAVGPLEPCPRNAGVAGVYVTPLAERQVGLLYGRGRHHRSLPPQFRHGTGGEENILQPPSLVVSAATAHKTFGLTDLASTYAVCTRRVFGSGVTYTPSTAGGGRTLGAPKPERCQLRKIWLRLKI